nr:hypothetical protein [uncultured Schaedlerella sp.]
MQMFKQVGKFAPDSLIASNEFPILKEGIGLKAGQGILKRGSLIMKGADKAGYIAGSVVKVKTGEGEDAVVSDLEMKVYGILTDEFDTGTDNASDNIPATVYLTGQFNREAVIVTGENLSVDNYEDDMKGVGMYLLSVQNYE